MIPKEGGNTFSGTASGLYTNDDLGANNLNDDLRTRGLDYRQHAAEDLRRHGQRRGARSRRDKLWFFTAHREWGNAHVDGGLLLEQDSGLADLHARSLAAGDAETVVRVARRAR